MDATDAYLAVRVLHIGCAALSITGFALRGVLMLRESPILQARFVRIAPHEERTFSLTRLLRETLSGHPLRAFSGNYTQKDVMEVARCLTGWTVRAGRR